MIQLKIQIQYYKYLDFFYKSKKNTTILKRNEAINKIKKKKRTGKYVKVVFIKKKLTTKDILGESKLNEGIKSSKSSNIYL